MGLSSLRLSLPVKVCAAFTLGSLHLDHHFVITHRTHSISTFIMARITFAIVLFLAVGALAMPQQNGDVKAPEPKEEEIVATTTAPAPPPQQHEKEKVVEKPVEKPVEEKPIELPVEEPVKKVEEPVVVAPPPKPEPKEAPKPVETEEPKKAEPEVEAKPEPEAENETTPKAAETTCVEKYRNCLEEANWAIKQIADCTVNAGSCLGGRLGIEF